MRNLSIAQQVIREEQMREYLVGVYGDHYFTLDDLLNMCFCDDGSIWIGSIEFKTPYRLEDY